LSAWTHLIPGFVVAGIGGGLVNPPLASTAVGVVTPERSGMASGVNTTFRQIGIATGIAVYGSIFASSLRHRLGQSLAGVPALDGHLHAIATAVQQGDVRGVTDVPPALRGVLLTAVRSSFTGSLDVLFVVSAILALVGSAASVTLIRTRDFVGSHDHSPTIRE
jgi:hypothetical protein